MGQRIPLAKDLAVGATGASVRIRAAKPPFAVSLSGTVTGTVTIQITPDPPSTADADANWDSVGDLGSNDTIEIMHPITRIRAKGDHTVGTPDVYLIEDTP